MSAVYAKYNLNIGTKKTLGKIRESFLFSESLFCLFVYLILFNKSANSSAEGSSLTGVNMFWSPSMTVPFKA